MALTNADIFNLQRAQRIGRKTEVIRAKIERGSQKAKFLTWGITSEAVCIGLALMLPTGANQKSLSGETLVEASNLSGAALRLSHQNKDNFDVALLLFNTEGKNLVFVPIEPITGLNTEGSYIMFPEIATFDGVIELVCVIA